jgi:ribA/ribD-fused uncharacterized protein
MTGKDQYTMFWHTSSPFSQWHPSQFVDGLYTYNTAEQYMMNHKALLFGDLVTAKEIMAEKDPRKQKALGRKVKNFDEKIWSEKCEEIVKNGNRAKFSQNQHLMRALLDPKHHGKEFVETSPYDSLWGIGLTRDDPRAWKKETWRGQNLLGKVITELRDEFMQQRIEK